MRAVFIGSGLLACPAVQRLLSHPSHTLVGVVTQPDRPQGRNLRTSSCPVRTLVAASETPVLTPERIGDPEAAAAIAALRPEILVVAAYGQFLRKNVLNLAPHGAINIHPSLLPRYRGAAPIQWALANGDAETGVTILRVTERMDAGDVILQERSPIRPDDTAGTLENRLAEQGAGLMIRALDEIGAGTDRPVPQEESAVTFAPRLSKEDGRIDWTRPAEEIRNRIRGFHPWPGCFTTLPGPHRMTLKIHAAAVEAGAIGAPGEILRADRESLLVATGRGALRLLQVQPEGRRNMTAGEFCIGCRALTGQRMGNAGPESTPET